jgi:hypothetical protein
VNSVLLKAACELLYQASLLVAAIESSRPEAAVSTLIRIETLARDYAPQSKTKRGTH